jgi:hypothetical protein
MIEFGNFSLLIFIAQPSREFRLALPMADRGTRDAKVDY